MSENYCSSNYDSDSKDENHFSRHGENYPRHMYNLYQMQYYMHFRYFKMSKTKDAASSEKNPPNEIYFSLEAYGSFCSSVLNLRLHQLSFDVKNSYLLLSVKILNHFLSLADMI